MRSNEATPKTGGRELLISPFFQNGFDMKRRYEEAWSRGHLENNQEKYETYRMLLDTINFDKIWELIETEFTRSGLDPKRLNRISEKDTGIRPIDSLAIYDSHTNRIAINDREIEFIIDQIKSGETPTQELAVRFIFTMVHEILHAAGRIHLQSYRGDNSRLQLEHRIGYSRGIETAKGTRLYQFGGFNEAVTEGMAQEIMLKYLRSQGSVPHLAEAEILKTLELKRRWRYAIYITQLQTVVERVAAHAGMVEQDIWNAIKQGYFAGEWLLSGENRALIDGALGEGFVREYAKISSESTDEEVEAFNAKYDIHFDEATIRRWLEHLDLRTKEESGTSL